MRISVVIVLGLVWNAIADEIRNPARTSFPVVQYWKQDTMPRDKFSFRSTAVGGCQRT